MTDTPRLTIGIPTYNRRDNLLVLLHAFEREGHRGEFAIQVNDNHGDYDVSAAIDAEGFPDDFRRMVSVLRRPYNVGGDLNIGMTILECRTEWLWLMGDDDMPVPGGLQTVLDDLDRHPDVAFTKYSLFNSPCIPFPDGLFTDLPSMLTTNKWYIDEMICMSVNVYHMPLLRPLLGGLLDAACTMMTNLVPALLAAKAGLTVRISSSYAAQLQPKNQIGWSPAYAHLCFGGILFLRHLPLTDDEVRAMREFLQNSGRVCTPVIVDEAPSAEAQKAWALRCASNFGLNKVTIKSVVGSYLPGLRKLWRRALGKSEKATF